MRRAAGAGLLGLALACAAAALPAAGDDGPALAEGNRRFRRGDYAGALAAYEAGWTAAPDPLLAYNLGAAAHRLGRLPEAVLWYRRAEAGSPLASLLPGRADPWLGDNLALARSELGAPRVEPRGWPRWAARRDALLAAGCLAAWAALVVELALGRRRGGRAAAVAVAAVALASFAAGWLLASRGPRPAVLLAGCGGLPAGSEVWVRRGGSEGRRSVLEEEGDLPCPAAAVGLVEADR